MSIGKALLYVNSKGFAVTRHSYSGSDSFAFCPRKYYLERVQGWAERIERSSTKFGIALEAGITFYHQHRLDVASAVAEFVRLWAEHKDKPYNYSKTDRDWDSLNLTGQEMIRLYALRYPTFPYTVNNPNDFQVQTNFEVFPDTKLAGIEFTSYIDLIAEIKHEAESPWRDYTKSFDKQPIIIDIKTSGKDVPELTVMDPQLRSYSWVKGIPHVAFLWFRKMGRSISKGDAATLLEAYAGLLPGQDVTVLATDDFGVWVTPDPQIEAEMNTLFVGKSKAVEAAKTEYIAAKGKHVLATTLTKQRVQFKMAVIPADSAEDIGRSIKRDVVNIAAANEKDFWPMQSGVRFPNEKCPNCAMRGICANNPELRDTLLVRKQLDEFDFGKESE